MYTNIVSTMQTSKRQYHCDGCGICRYGFALIFLCSNGFLQINLSPKSFSYIILTIFYPKFELVK